MINYDIHPERRVLAATENSVTLSDGAQFTVKRADFAEKCKRAIERGGTVVLAYTTGDDGEKTVYWMQWNPPPSYFRPPTDNGPGSGRTLPSGNTWTGD